MAVRAKKAVSCTVRLKRVLFVLGCVAFQVWQSPRPVHAQTPVQLRWHAPSECIREASAQRKLNAVLGEATAPGKRAVAEVRIARGAGEYDANIVFSGALTGIRQLHGVHCDSLSDAAVLIVAVNSRLRRARGEFSAAFEVEQRRQR